MMKQNLLNKSPYVAGNKGGALGQMNSFANRVNNEENMGGFSRNAALTQGSHSLPENNLNANKAENTSFGPN